jgi:hypothetical protein
VGELKIRNLAVGTDSRSILKNGAVARDEERQPTQEFLGPFHIVPKAIGT